MRGGGSIERGSSSEGGVVRGVVRGVVLRAEPLPCMPYIRGGGRGGGGSIERGGLVSGGGSLREWGEGRGGSVDSGCCIERRCYRRYFERGCSLY